jgi:type I restriction enzyme S subunit
MEVKPGYKQTEVGVIPEEWETAAVADLVEPSAPICYGVVQVGQHTESGVPIVAIKFVKEIAHAPLHRTAVNLEQPYARSRPKGGDVLISIKGTIGRVGIVPNGFQGNISRELARLRIREGSCPEYIAHQLEAGATQERIMRSVVGTTRLEFSIATLRKFPLPVPPTLPEQRAIATALSDVDGLLGGLDRLIAKKRDLKQAAMQQLLTGQTRLPGFHGEWEVKRLGDVVQIKKGQLITSSTLKQGDVPVIAGGKQPAYFHSSANRFGRTVTISASGASAGYVALYAEPIFASDCSTISESESYCLDFVFYQLLCKQQTIYKAQTGGAQPHIHAKDLNPILFSFPPHPEQTAIASVLSEMDGELAVLEQRREKTRALKQAMMQELLTGRTRLL